MKGFNRKRLIPSLAASVMVAAATLAPLPGFLASGNVYAAPPLGNIQVEFAETQSCRTQWLIRQCCEQIQVLPYHRWSY